MFTANRPLFFALIAAALVLAMLAGNRVHADHSIQELRQHYVEACTTFEAYRRLANDYVERQSKKYDEIREEGCFDEFALQGLGTEEYRKLYGEPRKFVPAQCNRLIGEYNALGNRWGQAYDRARDERERCDTLREEFSAALIEHITELVLTAPPPPQAVRPPTKSVQPTRATKAPPPTKQAAPPAQGHDAAASRAVETMIGIGIGIGIGTAIGGGRSQPGGATSRPPSGHHERATSRWHSGSN